MGSRGKSLTDLSRGINETEISKPKLFRRAGVESEPPGSYPTTIHASTADPSSLNLLYNVSVERGAI
jgi:hypothetical protein